jgi:hypothetical protein
MLEKHMHAAQLLADMVCALSRPSFDAAALAATGRLIEQWCVFVVENIARQGKKAARNDWNFPKFHLVRSHAVQLIRRYGALVAQSTSPFEATNKEHKKRYQHVGRGTAADRSVRYAAEINAATDASAASAVVAAAQAQATAADGDDNDADADVDVASAPPLAR